MPLNERNDPEMAYRRGYQDGASEMSRAVELFLDPATRHVVRAWIEQDIDGWRMKAILGHPPTWRLTELRAARRRIS
jgi:ribosome modulation factor